MAVAEEQVKDTYKTKVIHFLGRSTPIILQNDNGPCPLLAICNVLLLRNNLNLNLDTSDISVQRLLSLVAERLIDSNINIENKDAEYVQNQQQNIADAIELLPRLATGIDVNVRFRNVHDFEFTPECAIFDLLDIGLVHGWIFDPQDVETATVIESNSYNTLVEKLVALETRSTEGDCKRNLEEDCIDFAAATTATLGVPSPCLSRGRSFDNPPVPVFADQRGRKGDREEEEELMRVLNLSRADFPAAVDESLSPDMNLEKLSTFANESMHLNSYGFGAPTDYSEVHTGSEYQRSYQTESFKSEDHRVVNAYDIDEPSSEIVTKETEISFSQISISNHLEELVPNGSGDHLVEDGSSNVPVQDQGVPFHFPERMEVAAASSPFHLKPADDSRDSDSTALANASSKLESPCSDGRRELIDTPEDVSSSLEGSEPIYEGEDCILDSGLGMYEDGEPVYEGEMVLSKQANGGEEGNSDDVRAESNQTQQPCEVSPGLTAKEGELIRNFLKNNASQLTIYGLFCLQEGLKERELCVFFRNNHFSTMFKFNGELYLLATDQGYINQPDLVWEKLNEVNGDTVFMTGNFKEFRADNEGNSTWDEHNAMTSTADFLASMDKSTPMDSTLNCDLQLAIALQQQEFENQPQRQTPQNLKQPSVIGSSGLVTGPQVSPRSSSSTTRQQSKSKDKCIVM